MKFRRSLIAVTAFAVASSVSHRGIRPLEGAPDVRISQQADAVLYPLACTLGVPEQRFSHRSTTRVSR